MKDYREIWQGSEGRGKLTEEELLAYLEGRLSEAQRHELEALIAAEGMESDALEGLQSLDETEARQIRHSLNTALWKRIGKRRRGRRGMGSQQWTVIAVAVVLLLALACFLVFWTMRH